MAKDMEPPIVHLTVVDHECVLTVTSGLWVALYMVTVNRRRQTILEQITFIFIAGGNRSIFNRSVHHSLASLGYGSRIFKRMPLLTPNKAPYLDLLTRRCDRMWCSSMSHSKSSFGLIRVAQTP